jgi:hypothetical protein
LGRTVRELEQTMSLRELRDWQWFDAVYEPLPDRLADIHVGMLASLIVNLVRSNESTPATPGDFFIIKDRTAPQPQPQPQEREIDRLRRQWRGG